jgi:hypothetical protein
MKRLEVDDHTKEPDAPTQSFDRADTGFLDYGLGIIHGFKFLSSPKMRSQIR